MSEYFLKFEERFKKIDYYCNEEKMNDTPKYNKKRLRIIKLPCDSKKVIDECINSAHTQIKKLPCDSIKRLNNYH